MPAPAPVTIADAVIGWFDSSARDLPWRRPGFSAWGTLVSEFMLQQTPVSRVIPRLSEWLKVWPTPADLASVPPGEAIRAWASLGYPRRALWLHASAVAITRRFDGIVPSNLDDLLALPGIGDYTARAVAAFAYGERHPVVDTNVRRVLARVVDGNAQPAPPNTRRDLGAMDALLPVERESARRFNAGMMEIGAIVCTARSPRCEICPLANACAWRADGYPAYSGPRKPVQKAYAGSDRQARGAILRELRASHDRVPPETIQILVPDGRQRERAVAGLLLDGLVTEVDGGFRLP